MFGLLKLFDTNYYIQITYNQGVAGSIPAGSTSLSKSYNFKIVTLFRWWCARQGTDTWRWKSSMRPVRGSISQRQGQTREGMSEGSRRQNTGLTNRNLIWGMGAG